MTGDPYRAYLEAKVRMAPVSGLEIPTSDIHPSLIDKGHQAMAVQWAARGGRRAIFAAFGLGKTRMQLELIRLVRARVGGAGLICMPLGVRDEFVEQARELGSPVNWIREDGQAVEHAINLTNYEAVREGNVDPRRFKAASLDEASVLRSYGSKTFQTFLPLFAETPFRFVATATPSPNRYKELIHYAGYLGVMDTGQALTRFFQRDSKKAGNLTLYPHKEEEFWLWVASWALFIQRPSDLGFSDEGYEMPPLTVRWHEVPASGAVGENVDRDGQGRLIAERATGLVEAAREKRGSIEARIAKAAEIVRASPDDNFVIWHDLEDERAAIETVLPEAASVYGTQDLEAREATIRQFSRGWLQHLSTKPVLAGSGTNLQLFCHREVFTGIGFKFNDFIQGIYRVLRFGQTEPVEIDIIHTEAEREVRRELEDKWRRDTELRERMSAIIRKYGLNELAMAETLTRSIGLERVEASGENWRVANNDCVLEARSMPSNSIDLVVTSIPFSNHYEYTPSYNDFGHTEDDSHFFEGMDHLTPELLRVLRPGRVACIHVKDRILFGSVTGEGVPTVNPFHAKCIFHYLKHGFQYLGMHEVLTDVVRENNQTYRLGYTEMCKDATKMGCGSSEFVLLMRKPQSDRSRGYADLPVFREKSGYSLARWQTDAHAFWRSSGERLLTPEEAVALASQEGGMSKLMKLWGEESLSTVYDYEHHLKIGEALEFVGRLPSTFMALAPASWADRVWHDVNRLDTLNGAQAAAGREKHICPLQFDIVDRLIERYSMPGETVFDPFGGLFTVPLRALKAGRKGCASELNADYFRDGVNFLKATEHGAKPPTLFGLMGVNDAEAT
ncbi:MAG: DNA methyltransferase [Caulobacteraceae bacterium]|nr:DNA methyltransferase [Caulobacteraceae bacterium]